MTKTAGLGGTGIIASDFEEELSGVLTDEELVSAKALLNQVSVVREGLIAGEIGTSGMHDVTEGGILGAVWEMCHIAGLGCQVWKEQVAADPVTIKIAEHFDINWLRLISSGCMLIVAPEAKNRTADGGNSGGRCRSELYRTGLRERERAVPGRWRSAD